jgi:hypothetical protein
MYCCKSRISAKDERCDGAAPCDLVDALTYEAREAPNTAAVRWTLEASCFCGTRAQLGGGSGLLNEGVAHKSSIAQCRGGHYDIIFSC